MEIGIKPSSISKSFNFNRLPLDTIQQANKCVLDTKPQNKQFVDLNNPPKDQDDEGEIMLLAMILVQLQGQVPTSSPSASASPSPSPSTSSGESDGEAAMSDQEVGSIDSPDSSALNKKKRQRTSPDQLLILEEIFETDRMPNPQTRGHLADQLGMSSRRVQIWFQNKRAKVKREVSFGGKSPDVPSPSSSPSVPTVDEVPSSPNGAAVVPQISSPSKPSPAAAPVIIPTSSSVPAKNSFLPASNMPPSSSAAVAPMVGTILDNTSKQLKAQQRQFSRVAPFIDTQPVLTASY